MEKYIVELKKNETLYKAATRESDGTAYVCSAIGTPYTAPDLEQVRKEAYDDGYNAGYGRKIDASYQEGLSDAWEAARKILCYGKTGGKLEVLTDVFSHADGWWDIINKYTASEAIEKIRQYEQEQEEQIQVGDEVINRDKKAVVTEITDRFVRIMYSDGSGYALFSENMTKTGRNFPEIAEVLAKMKETDNG